MQTLLQDSGGETDWHHLQPLLDEVIVKLRDDEREAVALRFFEKRSFSEIGAALRLTEEAARKRVERSLEKLRALLARRGITSTTAVLGVALGELGAGSAPIDLAKKVVTGALIQGGATSAGTATLALTAVVGAALLGGVAAVSYQYHANRRLEAELARLNPDPHAITAVRSENQKLARLIAEADDRRRAKAERPAPRTAPAPEVPSDVSSAPMRATVTVQADGRLMWGRQPVSLAEFLARMKSLEQAAPDGDAKIGIRGFSQFMPLAYVIDEARKAQVKHVVVESAAMPDPKSGFPWFGWR